MTYVKNFFIVVGLFLLSQLYVLFIGLALRFTQAAGKMQMSALSNIACIIFILLSIWLMIFIAKKLHLMNFSMDFLTKENIKFIIAAFIFARLVVYLLSIVMMFQGSESTKNDQAIIEMTKLISPVLSFIMISFAAPIMEEIVFRGGIIGLLFKNYPIVGVIISSLLFGSVHQSDNFISFLIYTTIGFVLSYSYYKTKCLEVSISIHFLNNLIGGLAILFGWI
ncbi:CAAX protease [Enterococcus sp. JM4C]|uniref:CPBP family intramembrane glutamic endopeptidase n=1 Tax=Candidatus Enterococcus huntleyi TaxID=1857217 RepID=UPI00137A706A|nr:CPBP family intramembrane glutamic endopeptidase [Enterococcus sp. JM4C]KAF1296485.1 CAAX protease [Enterococcus sp. JM4C]